MVGWQPLSLCLPTCLPCPPSALARAPCPMALPLACSHDLICRLQAPECKPNGPLPAISWQEWGACGMASMRYQRKGRHQLAELAMGDGRPKGTVPTPSLQLQGHAPAMPPDTHPQDSSSAGTDPLVGIVHIPPLTGIGFCCPAEGSPLAGFMLTHPGACRSVPFPMGPIWWPHAHPLPHRPGVLSHCSPYLAPGCMCWAAPT